MEVNESKDPVFNNSIQNVEQLVEGVIKGTLSSEDIRNFLEVNKLAISSVASSFEKAMSVHENLSKGTVSVINNVIDALKLMIRDDMTKEDRDRIIDEIIGLKNTIIELHKEDRSMMKEMFHSTKDAIFSFAKFAFGVIIVVGGAVAAINSKKSE